MNRIYAFLILLFCGFTAQAQINPAEQDTIVKGFSTGKIEIEDPKSMVKAYSFDPKSGMYILSKTIGKFPANYPVIMSPNEYEERARKESMRDYFKTKLSAIDTKKDQDQEVIATNNLLPQYYVKSGLFKTIFGSNIIDIKPTGSVDIDFGVRYSKQDNPALSPRNRSQLSFDFDQRISMSLMGKVGTRVNVNINYDTQSTFSFQNLIKISFNPYSLEDELNQLSELNQLNKLDELSKELTDLKQLKNLKEIDELTKIDELDELNQKIDNVNQSISKLKEGVDNVKNNINKVKDGIDDARGDINKVKDGIDKVKNIRNGGIPTLGGKDDSIIKLIEVGNVNMPLNSSLIQGSQSLFGVKTQLQFGRTTVTGVFSEQKSESKTVVAEGGGTVQEFELFALDYDSDRHFFLSQYFRNKYDSALNSYPFIDSRVQITRLEVWVTNRQNRVNTTTGSNLRNIIAIQDLGEAQLTGLQDSEVVVLNSSAGIFNKPIDSPSDNTNNDYDPAQIKTGTGLLNSNIRDIATSGSGFNVGVNEGEDYSKLENARKLATNEYTFNPQLGYISLQQRLANDEVLAVAYQYTIGDAVYQVGEFGNDGVDATVLTGTTPIDQSISSQSLILKMLKSNLTNVKNPVWNLMMKNIYQIPGAYQLTQENFKFNILYSDPSPINYITPVAGSSFPPNPTPNNKVAETPLLKVFNLDKLNFNNDPQAGGDGFFDFMPGLTIDTQNARIIFTTKEPFGELLFEKLRTNSSEKYKGDPNNSLDFNPNQKKYVFRNMYAGTQASALQDADKNKFLLRGKYKSEGGDGIPIGAFNVPKGSVVVTAGGRVLVEGVDYSVNYQLGRVQILDPSLQASNTPINVTLENNAVFGQQTKRFFGINVEHKISEKFLLGATYLKLSERPFTQKASFGQETVNNSMFGFNGNYSSEIPFFTRLVNKLPFMDTDVPSNLAVRGEIAFLKPDNPKGNSFQGESTIYVDDFEGSQSTIDMRSHSAWTLASVPLTDVGSPDKFNAKANDLSYGFKRAKLSWYTIDPVFYTSKPSGISNDDLSLNSTRRIFSDELYPLTDIVQGQSQVINTFDLTYYPSERGPYNNSLNVGDNPKDNFGGIMRSLNSTNFEQGNVEYIQFWVLDPYIGIGKIQGTNTGKIYFNLGEISEDILKDGRKQYENGLGPDQPKVNPQPLWGDIPASQSLIYAFDLNTTNRNNQDIGLDGLPSSSEASIYTNYASDPDPAADNYTYFLNTNGGIKERYRNFNGLEGNSAVDINDANRPATVDPDVEDVNRDNTMNTINAYYEYSIEVKPNMEIGKNYITDIRNTQQTMDNGQVTDARWIQFKIPIANPENTIGNITDFRSIRFMRMFMTGFSEEVTVRFGALDLVRGDWRRISNTLDPNDTNLADDNTTLDVLAVNLQENNNRCPVNYTVPPGVFQEQLYNANSVINQNEQSLSLRISGEGLEPEDSRAVFKNVSVDMRQFNKLKMFLHAESLPDETILDDNQMIGFIRFGNDFTDNFYQIEIPLKVTKIDGSCSKNATSVWPAENEIDLALSSLTQLKIQAMSIDLSTLPADGIYYKNEEDLDPSAAGKINKLRIGIKGNPNFGMVRTLMLGVKSNEKKLTSTKKIKGEVWFNELRVADMDNKGGLAAVLNVDTNFADFATISATGRKSTIGFGGIEEGPNQRNREDIQQYNIVTNFSLGKLLPPKWKINLPFNYAVGEEIITPEYDPFNEDIKLKQLLDNTSGAERENIRNRAIDYTKRRSINFIGVRKDRGDEQKQRPYDIENFTFSQSYNEVERHDYEIEQFTDQGTNTVVDYGYSIQSKAIEPFKKSKLLKKSGYLKALSDFNFNYLPSNINFNTNIIRQFNRQQFRQVEVEGIGLDPLYRRNYAFNYNYGFNYNLTRNLKFNYTASTNNIVKNYMNEDNTPIDGLNIWDGYFDVGESNQHTQQLVMNYEIPLDKIPVFSFIKANYTYTGDYSWQRASIAMNNVIKDGESYNLGNTIQNAMTHNLNANMNMDSFYKYIGLKKSGQNKSNPKKEDAPKPGEKVKTTKTTTPKSNVFVDGLLGVITSVKTIQANYTKNMGTVLPGYIPGIGFFGTSKPTLGFVFGSQDDVRYETAKNGWLTNYQEFNQNFTQVTTETFKSTANIDLFPDLKIDLTFDRSYSKNFTEQYDVSDNNADGFLDYNPRSPNSTGMFSISTLLIKTAFSTSDANISAAFDDFRSNRLLIANRLATEYYGSSIPRYDASTLPAVNTDPNLPITDSASPNNPQRKIILSNIGFPVGFGKSNQAVLLPSFLAAYTGSDVSKTSLGIFKSFPLPNWAIKYNGLMRYDFFKRNFKRFSLQQNYRASYTINAFQSNLNYDKMAATGINTDANGNFFNKTIMSNVNLVEQFNPLVRVDFELNNSLKFLAEVKKDRALSMSLDNNLLTEVKGKEYIVGMGYRIKDVVFFSSLAGNSTGIVKSDIILKADFSYRNNKTIVRQLEYDNNQLAGGQDIWSLKITGDYSFNKNLTAIFFYDHAFSQAVISTSFPLTNMRSGFTLRYTFGN